MKNIFTDQDYQLWRLLTQTRNAILKVRHKELSAYNLTPRKSAILMIVEATHGIVTAYKIARWMMLEPHNISVLLRKMERDGLLRKTEYDYGEKTRKIELTQKGRIVYNEAMKFDSMHKAMAILSKKERQQLCSILKKLRGEGFKQLGIRAKLPFPPF